MYLPKQTLAFCLIFFWSHSGFPLTTDHKLPLKVVADAVSMNYETGISTLVGNVTATQGTTILAGDKMMVYMDEKQELIKLIAYGNKKEQAKYSTLPEKNADLFVATADNITYLNQEKLAIFEGDAHATDGRNEFQGPNFRYWTTKQEVVTEKSPNQQATILILPASSASK